jgi:dihydrodipicolinate synthase/N-acetylneuraminate lyase
MLSRHVITIALFLLALGTASAQCCAPCGDPCCCKPPPAPWRPCSCVQGWGGIYPTVLSPWNCDGSVDVQALVAQLTYQLNGGVHGLLLLGTIGEGEYATMEDRASIIATTVAITQKKVPIVVGIHTSDVDTALTQMHQAKALGADAVLVKYAGNPGASFPFVLGFYKALSDSGILPIFYYHYPSNTGINLTPKEVALIVKLPNFVGIKESTLNLREVEDHIRLTRGCGRVFLSGTALNLTQFLSLGGHGAMCPEAAILPEKTVCAFELMACRGLRNEARLVQKELFELVPVLRGGFAPPAGARILMMAAQDHKMPQRMGEDPSPARLKAALAEKGVPISMTSKAPQ